MRWIFTVHSTITPRFGRRYPVSSPTTSQSETYISSLVNLHVASSATTDEGVTPWPSVIMADEKHSAGTASPEPPGYDTLSIAPPTIDNTHAPSSGPGNGQDLSEANAMVRNRKKFLKERWQEVKEEDEKRKAV